MTPEELAALEELTDEGDLDPSVRPTLTIDPIAIRGRRRGFDTPEDVADSIRRKGAPARPGDVPASRVGTSRAMPGREWVPESARRATAVGDAIDAATSFAGMGTMARLPERARRGAREMLPFVGGAVGDALGDAAESGTAGSRGAVQGASLGFADELGAAGTAAAAGMSDWDTDVGEVYTRERDRARAADRADREASPWAYGGGELAGALLTAPFTPSLTGGRAATLSGRVGRGALEGAAYGTVGGFGASEGDLTTGEGRERLVGDTLAGTAGGGVFGAGGSLVGEGLEAGGRALRRSANRADELRTIAPAAGSAVDSDAMRSLGPVSDTARLLREMGIEGVQTAEEMAEAAARARRSAGEEIGRTRTRLDAGPPVPVDRLAGAMTRHADEVGRTTTGEPLADAIRGRAERLPEVMASEAVPYSRAIEELQGLQGDVNWTTRTGRPVTAPTDARRGLARSVRSELDEVARPVLGDEGLDAYRAARRRDHVAIGAEDAARATTARNSTNRGMSLSDYLMMLGMGGAGYAGGGPGAGAAAAATGAGMGLANRAFRLREPAIRATGAEAVRSLLETRGARAIGEHGSAAASAARRGGDLAVGRHAVSDPPPAAPATESATAGSGRELTEDDFDRLLMESQPTEMTEDDFDRLLEEGTP